MTALQTAQQTELAPTGYMRRFLQPEHTNWLCPPVLPTNLKTVIIIGLTMNSCGIDKWASAKNLEFKKVAYWRSIICVYTM